MSESAADLLRELRRQQGVPLHEAHHLTALPRRTEPCEHTWPGVFGSHYCKLSEPHTTHKCAHHGCHAVDTEEQP